jgi:PAS domain S-box-containing protein
MTRKPSPPSGDTATCPVTGLRIERRPDWRIETEDGRFGEEIEVIGGRILYVRPWGHVGLVEMEQVIALRARVVTEVVAEGRAYVQLSDHRDLRSADAAGRRRFAEAMIATPRLVGIVFFGVAPLLKLAINLGRRFHMIRRPLDVVETYEQGIRRALAILESLDSGIHPAVRGRSGSGVVVKRLDVELEGLFLRFEALPPDHMRVVVTGVLEERHLDAVFVAMNEVAEMLDPGFAIDVDVAGMRGVSLAVRRQYVARLCGSHRRRTFASYTLHGANALNRAAAIVTRPFVPFDLKVAPQSTVTRHAVRRPWFRRSVPTQDIDSLLEYFAAIDWSAPTSERGKPPAARDGPLSPIFDVVDLMAADVSQLLEERQLTEDALRESEERYRTILDNIADGFYEVDLHGSIVLVNDAALQMLDFSESEVLGGDFRTVVAPEDADRVLATFNQVFATGEPARAFKWTLVRRDGTGFPIEASVAVRTASDGTVVGFRGIIRDISERAKAERDRAALEAQLRVAQRLEALGTLAGGIAHNFNNLLMGIQHRFSRTANRHRELTLTSWRVI